MTAAIPELGGLSATVLVLVSCWLGYTMQAAGVLDGSKARRAAIIVAAAALVGGTAWLVAAILWP